MQMSLVLVVRGLLECVIENAKDCLASKCRGMRWLAANQNVLHVRRTLNCCLDLSRIESFILINCAESIQVCESANFFHQPSFLFQRAKKIGFSPSLINISGADCAIEQ